MSRDRITRLAVVFVAAAVVLILGLFQLAIVEHDSWLERSYRNRWAFRDVPTRRGEIFDRKGVPLAWDTPGFDLELTYYRFRREHPVGAVRHGADLLHAARAGGAVRYAYDEPARLLDALQDLLATPVAWLWDEDAWPRSDAVTGYAGDPGAVAVDVRFYTVAAIAGLGGVSRYRLGAELREAVIEGGPRGRVLDAVVRAALRSPDLAPLRGDAAAVALRLREALSDRLDELDRLDARLLMRSASSTDEEWSLWSRLERAHTEWGEWRRLRTLDDGEREVLVDPDFWAWAAEAGWTWRGWDDWMTLDPARRTELRKAFEEARERRLTARAEERVGLDGFVPVGSEEPAPLFPKLPAGLEAPRFRDEVRPARVRTRLAHEAAVWLALLAERHPGFELRPSVRRERGRIPGRDDLGSLTSLVGTVGMYDKKGRSPEYDAVRRIADADEFARVEGDLPAELDDSLRRTAARALRRHYAAFGRVGRSGLERGRDDVLSGRPGLRFVEHDKRARETRMFERLDVSPGRALTMTVDVRLQAIAERVVGAPPPDSEIALAVIEPATGDVLALVGRRHLRPETAREGEPAESWSNGATPPRWNPFVGSVAKPLVALEYLRSLRTHDAETAAELLPPSRFPICTGPWPAEGAALPYRGRTLYCGSRARPHAHGGDSRSTSDAIAVSCNTFFYEAASRLGPQGLARTYAQFGWTPAPDGGGAPLDVYQDHVEGMPPNYGGGPSIDEGSGFDAPHTGIGYGLAIWPSFVARAYAGIATGALPRLRIVRDGPARSEPLPYSADELEQVRAGLAQCVRSPKGTAERELGAFARLLETQHGAWLSGKTGTAVVQKRSRSDPLRPELNNAWFAGYVSDARAPRLAFAAVVYRSRESGGSAAAPVVRRFLEELIADESLAVEYLHGEVR